MDLDTSLEELSWIPRPRILALRRLGIETRAATCSRIIRAGMKTGANFRDFRAKKPSIRFVYAAKC